MRGTIKSILKGTVPGEAVPIVPGLLRPIDTSLLAQKLKLENQGKERGRKNLPRANESTPDAVEQSVIQSVTSEWSWNCNELGKVLKAYAERLNEISVLAEAEKLRLLANNAKARLLAANTAADADLGPLREAFLAARREYDYFKDRHRLIRPARDSSRHWTTAGLLIFLIAFESIINGLFFAKGSEAGLLGGIGTAVGISGLNVLFAFLVGLVPLRYMHRKNPLLRLSATILATIAFSLLIFLHAFAAHLRDATVLAGEEVALGVALAKLTTQPWLLQDLTSYYLFGLGVLFALAAVWKGYTFDDPYPGYGAVTRRLVHARESYSGHHLDLFDELESVKEDIVDRLIEGIDRIPIFFQRADQIRSSRQSLSETLRNYEPAIEAAANQLLKIYRDANRAVREAESPAHFNTSWILPHKYVDTIDFLRLNAEGEQVTKADVDSILLGLRPLADSLLLQYENLLSRYPHPTNMS